MKSPIEEIKDGYGVSDWELADAFNSHFGTFVSAPLRPTQAESARRAIERTRQDEREAAKQGRAKAALA